MPSAPVASVPLLRYSTSPPFLPERSPQLRPCLTSHPVLTHTVVKKKKDTTGPDNATCIVRASHTSLVCHCHMAAHHIIIHCCCSLLLSLWPMTWQPIVGGLYTPPHDLPDSGGFRRTQVPDFVSVTWAKFACPVWGESAGIRGIQPDKVQRIPPDSTGLHQIPPGSTRLHQSPPDSTGLCQI